MVMPPESFFDRVQSDYLDVFTTVWLGPCIMYSRQNSYWIANCQPSVFLLSNLSVVALPPL